MKLAVRVNHLVQKIGHSPLLNDLSFEVLPGECFGVFGTRGTGKTSLLHILAGVARFKSGEVEILGVNIRRSNLYKQSLGLVTQKRSLFLSMTVAENLDFMAALKNVPRANVLEMIGRFELESSLNEPLMNLDTIGVYQRLAMACALLNQPQLLIVDELIRDIDLYSRSLLLKELQRFQAEGGTVIYSFSHIEMSGIMSKVGWLEEGGLNVFTPEETRAKWHEQVEFYKGQGGTLHD